MTKRSIKILPKVFISYRRGDTGGDAGRLNDMLNRLHGPDRTFFDHDQIAPGMDFEVQLKRALSASDVLLALIGPKWETVSDSKGKPRLSERTISFESSCLQLSRTRRFALFHFVKQRHCSEK